MRGWRYESFRHGLSARGIKTGNANRYFAPKQTLLVEMKSGDEMRKSSKATVEEEDRMGVLSRFLRSGAPSPGKVEERISGVTGVEEAAEKYVRSGRPVERALDKLEKNDYNEALMLLKNEQYDTSAQKDALVSGLNAYAVRRAQSGSEVPDEILSLTDKNVQKRVDLIQKYNERQFESPLKAEAREDLRALKYGAVGTVEATPGVLAGMTGEGLRVIAPAKVSSEKKYAGVESAEQSLSESPFFTTNVFVGHEEDGILRPGWVDQIPERKESGGSFTGDRNVSMQGGAITGENIALSGNPIFGKEKPSNYSESVSRKVDSWDNVKIGKVDISAFKKGNDSFKKGDREGMINAIFDLKSQEGKLKDDWSLIEQTHAQLRSNQNHETAFMDGGSFFSKGGAERLSEQSQKLNDAKAEIVKANNKVFSRRRMLEYRLQRLDSNVPPESWAPEDVKRFDDGDKGMFGVDNPLI